MAGNFNEPGNPWRAAFDSTGLRWRDWDQRVNYQRNGFVAGLLFNMHVQAMSEPQGYSKAAVDEDRGQVRRRGRRDEQGPHRQPRQHQRRHRPLRELLQPRVAEVPEAQLGPDPAHDRPDGQHALGQDAGAGLRQRHRERRVRGPDRHVPQPAQAADLGRLRAGRVQGQDLPLRRRLVPRPRPHSRRDPPLLAADVRPHRGLQGLRLRPVHQQGPAPGQGPRRWPVHRRQVGLRRGPAPDPDPPEAGAHPPGDDAEPHAVRWPVRRPDGPQGPAAAVRQARGPVQPRHRPHRRRSSPTSWPR